MLQSSKGLRSQTDLHILKRPAMLGISMCVPSCFPSLPTPGAMQQLRNMELHSKIKFRTDGANKEPCFLSWDFGLVAYPDNALHQEPVSYFLTLLGPAIVFSTVVK